MTPPADRVAAAAARLDAARERMNATGSLADRAAVVRARRELEDARISAAEARRAGGGTPAR